MTARQGGQPPAWCVQQRVLAEGVQAILNTIIAAMPPEVAAVISLRPTQARERTLILRQLIFETAGTCEGVGRLTEALRWGEPAYLTQATKSGTTLRLGWSPAHPERCSIYFNCKTTLVETFRSLFADELTLEGNRALHVDLTAPVPEAALRVCFAATLTYHLDKRRKSIATGQ